MRRRERLEDGAWKKQIGRREKIMSMTARLNRVRGREGGERDQGSRKYGGGIRNNAVNITRRSSERGKEREVSSREERRRDGGKRKKGAICISVSTW